MTEGIIEHDEMKTIIVKGLRCHNNPRLTSLHSRRNFFFFFLGEIGGVTNGIGAQAIKLGW